ncbi:ABC transporter substrate-binding protein [Tersicoccus solisilvae]|uniref:Endolytic murein transglycosylase n=1 Tax=Tersicoccus solisilvae TaxID=1882339 RepID=A0ABQ1NQF7_9MICC|nr:endolytic transglycosylase MltG [Tersicoccus solisilvae]GGC82633.1 ABC transporter substrate-binding protein [Tersicoccus solisilvae]
MSHLSHGRPEDTSTGSLDAIPGFGHDDEDRKRHDRRARPPRRVRRRRTVVVLAALALVVVAVVVLANTLVAPFLARFQTPDYPGPGKDSAIVTVAQGDTNQAIGNTLVQQGVIASTKAFTEALQNQGGGKFIQPGQYQLKKEMKASDALTSMLDTTASAVHYAAVSQNLRQSDVFAILSKATSVPVAQFQALAKNPQQFGLPAKAPSLEGYLHPGEYRFALDAKPKDIIGQMVASTKKSLTDAGVTDPNEQYRLLTIASIIEAEAGEADYGKVSGAIYNRLGPNNKETVGRLDSDATVSYGLGRRSYQISNEEKQDASNKYNTFANPGLPVGPIGSPAGKAIEAAKNPEKVPYFYWVTVNLDTGETKYATTLEEHQRNVDEYTAWCGANPGKCD